MKEKYSPIQLPVCLCGRQTEFVDARKKFGIWNNAPIRKQLEALDVYVPKLHIPQGHRYGCICRHCGIVKPSGTKRQAVEAFMREVEINVTG